ncbi:MAG: aspartate dehydrogenase [Lachnospiraceae bacterium]|nr:aspartate dehydrogenase [Lachnospiraceae bacterium]MBR3164672.1 aspartate dehydrogenase [Lachnospiraceae bacterium]
MFGRRKRQQMDYDREKMIPAVRKSICTGEETAGFKDKETGKFHEVMLLKGAADLRSFMEMYNIQETPETIY